MIKPPFRLSIFLSFASLVLLLSCHQSTEEVKSPKSTVKMNISSNPRNVNPFYYSNSTENLISTLQFQTLLAENDNGDGIAPILAERVPVKDVFEDSVVIRYQLREDASWDDGSPLTSGDVLSTFKIIFNPHSDLSALKSFFDFIEDIKIVDDKNFMVICRYNNPDILFHSGDIEVVPSHLFDPDKLLEAYSIPALAGYEPEKLLDSTLLYHGNEIRKRTLLNPEDQISGSGPYQMLSYSESDKVVLTKKQDWWGHKYKDVSMYFEAYPEKIELKIFTDPMSAYLAFSNRELNILRGPNEQILEDLKRNSELAQQSRIDEYPAQAFVYIAANTRHPILRDKNVRKALAFLINPEGFIENVLKGAGKPVIGPITSRNRRLYNPHIEHLRFNIDSVEHYLGRAAWIREDDGWYKNGSKLRLPLLIQAGNQYSEDFAVFFKNEASKAGVEIQLLPLEFTAFINKIRKGDYALARLAMSSGSFYYDFRPLFHSQNIQEGRNYPGFFNPEADKLIDSLDNIENQDLIEEISHRLQELIFQDYSYLFLYTPVTKNLLAKDLENIKYLPSASLPWPGSVKFSDNE